MMNEDEFKQYYFLEGRENTLNTDRLIYFGDTDADNDK
jgi:hypothetical protein